MAKVFYPDAPTCPECGNKMVWDEDEDIWYCPNCGYWEEEEEYFGDEEEDEWEDPYSCFGTFKPGIEECEACPLREECEKVTEPWWIEEERDGRG